jgi:hypothetical protein
MPYEPGRRGFTLRTIRDFIDCNYWVAAHCYAWPCGHSAQLDLVSLGKRFGYDVDLPRGRLRCSRCGSGNVSIRIGHVMPGER